MKPSAEQPLPAPLLIQVAADRIVNATTVREISRNEDGTLSVAFFDDAPLLEDEPEPAKSDDPTGEIWRHLCRVVGGPGGAVAPSVGQDLERKSPDQAAAQTDRIELEVEAWDRSSGKSSAPVLSTLELWRCPARDCQTINRILGPLFAPGRRLATCIACGAKNDQSRWTSLSALEEDRYRCGQPGCTWAGPEVEMLFEPEGDQTMRGCPECRHWMPWPGVCWDEAGKGPLYACCYCTWVGAWRQLKPTVQHWATDSGSCPQCNGVLDRHRNNLADFPSLDDPYGHEPGNAHWPLRQSLDAGFACIGCGTGFTGLHQMQVLPVRPGQPEEEFGYTCPSCRHYQLVLYRDLWVWVPWAGARQ